jgi:FKBP-type peptidyl-prolyl cis-trans isomerase
MKLKYVPGIVALLLIVVWFSYNNQRDVASTAETHTTNTTMNETSLKIEDEVVGTGDTAVSGNTVTVHYVGSLTNGTVFDASRNHGNDGFTFTLGAGQVIKGWDMGVAGMKVGGKRKLTIPSDLAYGNRAVGGVIPANSTLLFTVELLKVSK